MIGKFIRTSTTRALVTTAGLLAAASGAHAATATYTLSGALDGKINGTPFTNEAFTFTLIGDSSTIVDAGGSEYIDPLASGTITLNGIGAYTVLIPLALHESTFGTEIALDEYEPALRNVFLWDTTSHVDIIQSFAPVGSDPFLEVIGDAIPTSGGSLQFDSFEGTGPTLTLSGTVVPEPATWTLMLAGLGVAGAAVRTRRKAAVG